MSNLWKLNTPDKFWMCQPPLPDHSWQVAVEKAFPLLGLGGSLANIDELLMLTLGEGRFGSGHWRLSLPKRLYYLLKPLIPRPLTRTLRRIYRNPKDSEWGQNWRIDSRYSLFQWEVLRQVLISTGMQSISYKSLWPDNCQFAFALTHDIETAEGQAFVGEIANIEEGLGFRSSFNFVLERYALDHGLIRGLRNRGFEIGCHGLKHDGKLYNSKTIFQKRAVKINAYLQEYKMVGFRSPLTHRNPEWLQELDVEYDSSFFDTDPFEPIPGGTMSIWPFFLGHFVELPYTLVQDYTLATILGETTPRIWLDKIEFIRKYRGMALLNTHPDYLKGINTLKIYTDFLRAMKNSGGYWHALPHNIAGWWKTRSSSLGTDIGNVFTGMASLDENQIIKI